MVHLILFLLFAAPLSGCLPTPVAVECPELCEPSERRCDPENPGTLQECAPVTPGACPDFVDVQVCSQNPSQTCIQVGGEGARCASIECAPGRCAPGRGPACGSDGSIELCDTTSLDDAGCGEVTTRDCGVGRVCQDGECVEEECPAVGVICEEGDRACSPDDELLECMIFQTGEGRPCARFEVTFDCVEEGGACDALTRRCKASTCDTPGERRCEDGEPQVCRRTGNLLDWETTAQCVGEQVCVEGECVCPNAPCSEEGAMACAPDGMGVDTCTEVNGCFEYATTGCDTGQVCVESGGQFSCICPPIDETRPPVEGQGCDPLGAKWSCGADGGSLMCGVVEGVCQVWKAETTCEGESGVVACQGPGAIVCEEITSAFGDTCLRPIERSCPNLGVCMTDVDGNAACM